MDNHALQNTNQSEPFVYTLSFRVNLLDYNPEYPKNPTNFGMRLRKARMDKGLKIVELAHILSVSEDSVINWEKRGVEPKKRHLKAINKVFDIFLYP